MHYPAGWYPTPVNKLYRWWDGQQWRDLLSDERGMNQVSVRALRVRALWAVWGTPAICLPIIIVCFAIGAGIFAMVPVLLAIAIPAVAIMKFGPVLQHIHEVERSYGPPISGH